MAMVRSLPLPLPLPLGITPTSWRRSQLTAMYVAEDNPFFLLSEDIRWDLTWRRDNEKGERPLYPFGAYGPGKGAPKQLIEGELEQSPEELRVQAYLANSNGQLPQFVSTIILVSVGTNADVECSKRNMLN